MRVSQKADYALRAMFQLAKMDGLARPIRTAEVAQQERLPEKFLEGILVELRKAGLVKSLRGKGGGHRLSRPARDITIGDIWRAVDGDLSPSSSLKWDESARNSVACRALLPIWQTVHEAASRVVNEITLAEFLKRADELKTPSDYSI
ncbi:MAG: Rrf2 family transcriptional regulator [Myxococcota bacterium]|nr:Rrf2 family transcriptional regulator [Myxococcota bacterium]